MFVLEVRPTASFLVCTTCDEEWAVDEVQPFVAQLRLLALGHSCAPAAKVIDAREVHQHQT